LILRICVVIPTFNNSRTISEVVKDVVTNCCLPVLVVDDGSETLVSNGLYSWDVRQAVEQGRVKVERLPQQRGRGSALRFAIERLVAEGYTHMLTMDAEGQYMGSEIGKLVELAQNSPDALILGDRQLRPQPLAEGAARGLRQRMANLWVSYQTGSHVKDSQSTFRLYPLFHLQTMKFWSNSSDFDIEALIRLLWKGVHPREVAVSSRTLPPTETPNRLYRMWRDLRASTLNIVLLSASLLKTHRSPFELSAALGLGVFIGCTPFFGFHTLLVAAFALLFRLNLIVMWMGTHVSTPLIAPFVVMAEIWVGHHWLHIGEATGGSKDSFYQWMAGSLAMGVVLGVATMVIAFVLSWLYQNRQGQMREQRLIHSTRVGRMLLKFLVVRCGLRAAHFWAPIWAANTYLFAAQIRKALAEYWKITAQQLSWRDRQLQIYRHFLSIHQMKMDHVYTQAQLQPPLAVAGESSPIPLQAAVLSAHLGDWDFVQSLLGAHALTSQRFVIDRPRPGDFELIPFFGKLAAFDMQAFEFAASRGLPLTFAFAFKSADMTYRVQLRPPRAYRFEPHLSQRLQCYRWACEFVVELEKIVVKHPLQWGNFFAFWSELPGSSDTSVRHELIEDLGAPSPLKPEIDKTYT
jgi:uncharacterized protein (DUF2062 family)/predicted LPLAT superfamily acyltransferase